MSQTIGHLGHFYVVNSVWLYKDCQILRGGLWLKNDVTCLVYALCSYLGVKYYISRYLIHSARKNIMIWRVFKILLNLTIRAWIWKKCAQRDFSPLLSITYFENIVHKVWCKKNQNLNDNFGTNIYSSLNIFVSQKVQIFTPFQRGALHKCS